jgi:hypothetical protein
MLLRGMLMVLCGMKRMAVRHLGMVGRCFMLPSLRMFSCFSMMRCGMFVMFGSFLVVFVDCEMFHNGLLGTNSNLPT